MTAERRNTILTDQDVLRIANALRFEIASLTAASRELSDEEHQQHRDDHEFIALMRRKVEAEEKLAEEKRIRRQQMEDRIKGSIILMATIGVIGMIGAGFTRWVQDTAGHSTTNGHQERPK